jgi:hypothetical protein
MAGLDEARLLSKKLRSLPSFAEDSAPPIDREQQALRLLPNQGVHRT